MLDLHCCMGFSLVAASRRYSSCTVWASHCNGLSCCKAEAIELLASVVEAWGLRICSSRALEHGLNSCGAQVCCAMAGGIFLDQGSNPCLLHWQADPLPLSHQGSLPVIFFFISRELENTWIAKGSITWILESLTLSFLENMLWKVY